MSQRIGYARVSTTGQSLDIQLEKLAGCDKVYKEKVSAASTNGRPELKAALDYVREGDVFVVSRLDRLARSVTDLAEITRTLEAKGVDLVVLDQSINTTTPAGRLLFHILGSIAEFERELIRERAFEGRAKAKAEGVKFGAHPKLTMKQLEALQAEFMNSGTSKKEIAARFGISRSSAYRLVKSTTI